MIKRLALATTGALLVAAAIFATTGVARSFVESATGSGQIHIVGGGPCAGQLRTLAFTVRKYDDGTFEGESQIHVVREQGSGPDVCDGDIYHADLNCLQIFGNVAIASGPITEANEAAADFVGRTELLIAEDNGEGANAEPDRIVRVPPLPLAAFPTATNCLSFSLTNAQFLLTRPGTGYAVEAGNVQIHTSLGGAR